MKKQTERQQLTSEQFRSVMGHFASGVTVITAHENGDPVGTTASAFSSLSLDPPMLLVCLNQDSHTGQVIRSTGRFGVNIIGEDGPDLAMRFARKGGDKFAGLDWHSGGDGIPLLDAALASIECRVVEETQGGTHSVFIAAAQSATLKSGAPLAYFRGRFGRLETEGDIHAGRLIQNWILAHDSEVGAQLDIDSLARELDLPRGTVYHALGTLRDQGLVYRDEDGAFRVATLSTRMVTEALEARRTIELGVLARVIGKVTEDQIRELHASARATLPDSELTHSASEWARANREFHEKIVNLTGNGSLANVYRQFNITAILGRIQADAGGIDPRELSAGEEHVALVAAIEASDYDAAVSAIVRHAENSIAAARRLIEGAEP